MIATINQLLLFDQSDQYYKSEILGYTYFDKNDSGCVTVTDK